MSLGLAAPVARFVRAIASAAVAGFLTATISQFEAIKSVIVDVVSAIPVISVESEQTIAVVVFAVLTAVVLAADKFFRDEGMYPNFLE